MKIGIVGDIHWSQYSSIVRSRGENFSTRLENCIASINWAEETLHDCDLIIYLGDFLDKSELNAEEITALNYIEWNDSEKWLLVGNHEMALHNLSYSSAHLFGLNDRFLIIDKPMVCAVDDFTQLCLMPYVLEENRKSLLEYFPKDMHTKRILFSHNDIKDIQYGQWKSSEGFGIDDITMNFNFMFNGHLHNNFSFTENVCRVTNVGNLTGQNFSEDSSLYSHYVYTYDTKDDSIQQIKNPYAFNFYKMDTTHWSEVFPHNLILPELSVLSIKCREDQVDAMKELLNFNKNIVESRLVIDYNKSDVSDEDKWADNFSVDHLETFRKYIVETYGNTEIIQEELNNITQ